jgi:hypothetical protein
LITNPVARGLLVLALALLAFGVWMLMRIQFGRQILPRALIFSILSCIGAIAAVVAAYLVQG